MKGGGGSISGLQAKGGAGGGPILGPMLKSLQRGPKRGSGPPAPPGSAHDVYICVCVYIIHDQGRVQNCATGGLDVCWTIGKEKDHT